MPSGTAELEQIEQCLLFEVLVTDNVDLFDAGGQALGDVDGHGDPVALQRRHRGPNLDAVLPERIVLAFQLLLDPIQEQAVERPALHEADLLERCLQPLGFDGLVSRYVDLGDGRPFPYPDHQDRPVPLYPHILEKTRCIEGADDVCGDMIRHRIPHLDGECVEDGAGSNPL